MLPENPSFYNLQLSSVDLGEEQLEIDDDILKNMYQRGIQVKIKNIVRAQETDIAISRVITFPTMTAKQFYLQLSAMTAESNTLEEAHDLVSEIFHMYDLGQKLQDPKD